MPRPATVREDEAGQRKRALVTRNRVLVLGLLVGLLIGLGGTVVYLGYMATLSAETIPGSRFELSERDLWQRRAEGVPPVAAAVGFFLAAAAFVWPWMARRRHLARVAWPLAVVVGGFAVLSGWVYVDVLTTVPCHEEADDCGPSNAFRLAHPVLYLLPIAAVLVAGLWRRRRPAGQRLLAAGCTAVVAVIAAYGAHAAASAWVPPLADRLAANECAVSDANNLAACVQTPGYDEP